MLYIQSTPPGTPDCVQPNLDKVDLSHLKSDIPKYERAGLFNDEANDWWHSFLSGFEATYGTVPSITPTWPVDVFKSIIASGNAESNSVIEVSEKITSIHSTQMENHPKVN